MGLNIEMEEGTRTHERNAQNEQSMIQKTAVAVYRSLLLVGVVTLIVLVVKNGSGSDAEYRPEILHVSLQQGHEATTYKINKHRRVEAVKYHSDDLIDYDHKKQEELDVYERRKSKTPYAKKLIPKFVRVRCEAVTTNVDKEGRVSKYTSEIIYCVGLKGDPISFATAEKLNGGDVVIRSTCDSRVCESALDGSNSRMSNGIGEGSRRSGASSEGSSSASSYIRARGGGSSTGSQSMGEGTAASSNKILGTDVILDKRYSIISKDDYITKIYADVRVVPKLYWNKRPTLVKKTLNKKIKPDATDENDSSAIYEKIGGAGETGSPDPDTTDESDPSTIYDKTRGADKT